eukprot:GHVP01068756.1.p1 GENE.GHVP01068756.1~~GHVP01068756.1.p1  ORF type:complete len:835 (-),score=109.66 GHVP01068756.1:1849-4353(-)
MSGIIKAGLATLSVYCLFVGFFPMRAPSKEKSTEKDRPIDPIFEHKTNILSSHPWFGPNKQTKRPKIAFIILDGLRYDCVAKRTTDKEIYHNKMPFLQELVERKESVLFKSLTPDSTTTTHSKTTTIFTGTIPDILSLMYSFNSQKIEEDSIFRHLLNRYKRLMFTGDETTISLFDYIQSPKTILSSTSTFVNPFYSFDLNNWIDIDSYIKEDIIKESKRIDHELIFAHSVSIDHASHINGLKTEKLVESLKETDEMIREIYNTLSDDTEIYLTGDHGMTENGGHGGLDTLEITTFLMHLKKGDIRSNEDNESYKRWNDLFNRNEILRTGYITGVDLDWPYHTIGGSGTIIQNDIATLLSIRAGIPTPYNSIGCIIPELIVDLSYIKKPSEYKRIEDQIDQLKALVDSTRTTFFQIRRSVKNDISLLEESDLGSIDDKEEILKVIAGIRELGNQINVESYHTNSQRIIVELEELFFKYQKGCYDLVYRFRKEKVRPNKTRIAIGAAILLFLFLWTFIKTEVSPMCLFIIPIFISGSSICYLENEDYATMIVVHVLTMMFWHGKKDKKMVDIAGIIEVHLVIFLCSYLNSAREEYLYTGPPTENIRPFSPLSVLLGGVLLLSSLKSYALIINSLFLIGTCYSSYLCSQRTHLIMLILSIASLLAIKGNEKYPKMILRFMFLWQKNHFGFTPVLVYEVLSRNKQIFNFKESPINIGVWAYALGSYIFFKTGHQSNIATIPWGICCIGGNTSMILSGIFFILNFAPGIVFAKIFCSTLIKEKSSILSDLYLWNLVACLGVLFLFDDAYFIRVIQRILFVFGLYLGHPMGNMIGLLIR